MVRNAAQESKPIHMFKQILIVRFSPLSIWLESFLSFCGSKRAAKVWNRESNKPTIYFHFALILSLLLSTFNTLGNLLFLYSKPSI